MNLCLFKRTFKTAVHNEKYLTLLHEYIPICLLISNCSKWYNCRSDISYIMRRYYIMFIHILLFTNYIHPFEIIMVVIYNGTTGS